MTYYLGILDSTDRDSLRIHVPDLPGCQAKAREIDEAYAKAIDAVRAWATRRLS